MRAAVLGLAALLSATSLQPSYAQVYRDGGALRRIDEVLAELEHQMRESCDPKFADKAKDAVAKLESAADELAKAPPDRQAAAGSIEGAAGDLEAAVKDECFDVEIGVSLMDDLVGVTRRLATRALDAADEYGGKGDDLREADRLLDRADSERSAGRRGDLAAFKRAAAMYKDALAKAEGAMG